MAYPDQTPSQEQSREVLVLLQVLALGETRVEKKQAIPMKQAFAQIRRRIHLAAKKREQEAD
jgi:hypothetical protein